MTDSSVQLTPEEVEKYDITVVPLTITIDGKSYVDGIDITRSDFVKKMNEAESLPKTSQPPIGRFVDAARQAAEIAGQSDNVTIIDSELTDRAEGFQVLAAAKDAQAGKSMAEIIDHVKKIRSTQKLEMMVVNLQNLIKGGRLGALSGRIATMLNIRIALQMPQGKLIVAKKGRGKKFTRAFDERVLKEIADNKEHIKEVGISYVDTPELMEELAEKIRAINPAINVLVAETSPIIATHAGNGAYAILYYVE